MFKKRLNKWKPNIWHGFKLIQIIWGYYDNYIIQDIHNINKNKNNYYKYLSVIITYLFIKTFVWSMVW